MTHQPRHTIAPLLLQGRVRVALVGAGGSGSQMLSGLARLDRALRALEHPGGLSVTVWDPDTVSMANVGRQLFYPSDVGHPKATVLVHRVNCAFGLDWTARTERFTGGDNAGVPDVLITCVDSAKARRLIHQNFGGLSGYWKRPAYWLDMGNRARLGQVFLTQPEIPEEASRQQKERVHTFGEAVGEVQRLNRVRSEMASVRLPDLAAVLPELLDESLPEDDAPSCSLAEALERQDLFVNQAVVTWASHLLWTLFRRGGLDHHGYWINLETGSVNAVPVPAPGRAETGRKTSRKRRKAGANG